MIRIMNSVWRADCIAALDIEDDTVQVIPMNCSDVVPYTFDTVQEAVTAYKAAVEVWIKELE